MNSGRDALADATTRPVVLFDDECGVCRGLAGWVSRSARLPGGQSVVDVRPIGEDPDALRALNPTLSIWEAYETIHLLMPDGSMRLGGQAIAALLHLLPNTRWFAGIFSVSVLGWQPFQQGLDLAYAILAAVRPIFGCESCGHMRAWMRPLAWVVARLSRSQATRQVPAREPLPQAAVTAPAAARHFTARKPVAKLL